MQVALWISGGVWSGGPPEGEAEGGGVSAVPLRDHADMKLLKSGNRSRTCIKMGFSSCPRLCENTFEENVIETGVV